MAENTIRKQKANQNIVRNTIPQVRTFFSNLAGLDTMIEKGLPTTYIPNLLFLAFLGILYIGNAHYADKMIREINKSSTEVEKLKADYRTSKVEFLHASKLTSIQNEVKKIGLVENNGKVYRIKVKKDEY